MTSPTPEEHPMNLPTCPREDCPATIDHWHDGGGDALVCSRQLGRACFGHESGRTERSDFATRCYAPRTPQPQPAAVVLPTVKEVRRTMDDAYIWHDAAQDVLDLISARLPVWQPVAPGTTIKAGTRVRSEWTTTGGEASEWDLSTDITFGDPPDVRRVYIDPRTVPAEPEDPALELVAEELHDHGGCEETWPRCSVSTVENYRNDARDLLARIDAARAGR